MTELRDRETTSQDERCVSPRLLQAALAGLVSLGLMGCGSSSSEPHITSTKHVENLDEAGFTELCDARGGRVEVMAHCGGLATARGFSYDITTQELAEHTCKGANTCAGWNCITNR
ncbi:MAG TPA: hypothetical protein VHB79_03575 [Polyangiaceae bacterium]|nr:hypothetical protein [Polyangiaceae bacterium]